MGNEEFENMATEELLLEVKRAIRAVLAGGQAYKIGSRELTRANLAELREMRLELEAEMAAGTGGDLLENTVVAVFDRR